MKGFYRKRILPGLILLAASAAKERAPLPDLVDPVQCRAGAELVRDGDQRRPDRAVLGRNEQDALGAEIARLGALFRQLFVLFADLGRIDREIAEIDLLLKRRSGRIGHVVDVDAADPLRRNEGVAAAADRADRDDLRFGSAIGALPVELDTVV